MRTSFAGGVRAGALGSKTFALDQNKGGPVDRDVLPEEPRGYSANADGDGVLTRLELLGTGCGG